METRPFSPRRLGPGNEANPRPEVTCYRCGRKGHISTKCHVDKDVVCHGCKRKGHLKRACTKGRKSQGPRRSQRPVRKVEEGSTESSSEGEDLSGLHHVSVHAATCKSKVPPLLVTLRLDECEVSMELDTGASMSLISEETWKRLWPGRVLSKTQIQLCTYSKEPLPVLGCAYVNLEYKGQLRRDLPLPVVKGCGPSLFGRNWLESVRLDWHEIHSVVRSSLQEVLDRHQPVFQPGLGKMRGFEAKLYVDPTAKPRYYRPRSVPYALTSKIEEELDRLVAEGTLEPVETADWAAPIVPVLKADKKNLRICGDFRLTVNPVAKLDNYPIPRVEDLFAKLQGSKSFTKLDLQQAYQQLPLEEGSKNFVVINTHKGLLRYTRLPFGVASAPGIFQREMEKLLKGIKGVVVFIDDILIARESDKTNLESLEEVLRRIEDANLRLKLKKCQFLKSSVDYLGYRIDAEGLHPLEEKVKAIQDAPAPNSVQELKSYLGLIAYYSKFMPNLASVLHPLYILLRKSSLWKWGRAQQKAFEESKLLLTSDKFLVHFDPDLKLSLACDASAYGLGVILSHKMASGDEQPIAYASRTLSDAERNYSQLEKEGLSCIFGIKKFHNYLFGHPFELITDHKPLLGLLRGDKVLPAQASARIKRWSLFLSNYEYQLLFRDTKSHANADALSRLPLPDQPLKSVSPPELVLLSQQLENSPVSADQIRTWTRRDARLSKVLHYVQCGWPNQVEPDLVVFSSKRLELSAYDGCLLWGNRVVVPSQGREAILQELHGGHPGICRMRSLARMYVWWPGLDSEIERTVRSCTQCQVVQAVPPQAPLNPWKWPSRPWARLHVDFAGPFQGKIFLVIIDAHSKWIEAMSVSSTSSAAAISELRTLFSRYGIPETVVSDNGTGFTSKEFQDFLTANGVKHLKSAPYHPATNGLAERAVQIVKRGLKKVTAGSVGERLARVLFAYRITPQSTTGMAPDELLLGRKMRTRLDLLRPNSSQRVESKQLQQKQDHDSTARSREFTVGDLVSVCNFGQGDKWLPGVVIKRTGPVSFCVAMDQGVVRRCHQDQLRSRSVASVSDPIVSETTEESPLPDNAADVGDSESPGHNPPLSTPARAYPSRVRNPPDRFTPSV